MTALFLAPFSVLLLANESLTLYFVCDSASHCFCDILHSSFLLLNVKGSDAVPPFSLAVSSLPFFVLHNFSAITSISLLFDVLE